MNIHDHVLVVTGELVNDVDVVISEYGAGYVVLSVSRITQKVVGIFCVKFLIRYILET